MAYKLLLLLRQKKGILLLLGWRPPFVRAPPEICGSALPDLCWICVPALCSKCLPAKQTRVVARFQTAGLLSPADVCSRPATTRNRTQWRTERFLFCFSDKSAFYGSYAPDTRPVQNPPQESNSFFFLAYEHTASLVSNFVFLACFFRKRPLPFAHFKNSLDSRANGNRGNGTPYLFPGKNDPFDSLQTPFPTVTLHFVIDIHSPPTGLVLHPAYRLSRISPFPLNAFF